MINFNILKVEKVVPNKEGKVCVYNEYLKQDIELPYPEFNKEIIIITANPIYRDLDEDTMSVVTAIYSEAIGPRTFYFLRPFSQEKFDYFNSLMSQFKSDKESWVPFIPEEKMLTWLGAEDGTEINFFKNISFNEDWVPVTHFPYVNSIRQKIGEAIQNEGFYNLEEYIDYMDFDIDKFQRDDSLAFDDSCLDNFEDEAFNVEFFGKEGLDNINDDRDDITACLERLFEGV